MHEQRAPGTYLRASPESHCLTQKLQRLQSTGFPLGMLNYDRDGYFVQHFVNAVGLMDTSEIHMQRRNTSLGCPV